MNTKTKNNLGVPIAIVLAGALVAGAVLFAGSNKGGTQAVVAPSVDNDQQASLDALDKITKDDYIRGNPDAKVKVVEFSDFECPFCKRFHDTMNQVMAEYGESGDVAWVFRQFPLDSLHPIKAKREAVAAECAGDLGGNDVFWDYTDRLFELSLTNNRTDVDTVLPQIANELGLDEGAFAECLASGKFDSKIAKSVANAAETGGRGTPWSIVIAEDGTKYPVNGAQPIESVRQIIEIALSK